MMNRKSLAVLARKLFLTAAVAAVPTAASAADWILYHHQSAPQFTTSVGSQKMTEEIEQLTNGEVKIRLRQAGTLQIAPNNISQAVAENVVQMGDDQYFAGNVPIGNVLKLPFLIQSYEEYEKAAEIVRPYVAEGYAKLGVTVLSDYVYPMQYLWGRAELTSLDSINGAKIRVASPEAGEAIRRFGGSSVTLGASEVPSALDRGVVDGIITGTVGADLWQDMLNTGYLLGLNYNNVYIIVNTSAFEGLSPEQQEAVRTAAQNAAQWDTETMRSDDQSLIDTLGGKIEIVRPTDADKEKAFSLLETFWEEWANANGETAVEVLAKVREALGR